MATIKIHEQTDANGRAVYHWQILDDAGNEFSHSAYHFDRAECEREAAERLAHAKAQDWIA
jgi:hypothetical protein